MTTGTDRGTTRPPRSPRVRPRRGEGQWALGHREPLNANDLRGRFRWMRLYPQRKPGLDGSKTSTLDLSIGCAPRTRRVEPGEDTRSGRWPGLVKSECGLHT